MAHPDILALRNSELNALLFADVGTELNGSALTVLSVLARLGEDPWAEAARWAKLPKSAAVRCLAESIAQMPLAPQALADAPTVAARLILLLPPPAQMPKQGASAQVSMPTLPRWVPAASFCCALAVWLALNLIGAPKPVAAVATPAAQAAQLHQEVPASD